MATANPTETVSRWRRIVSVGLVLVFAVCLRVYFHRRVLGTLEFAVARPAMRIASGDFVPAGGSTSYQYGVVYPTALCFRAFGKNFVGLTGYSLLCSIGTLLVAYAFAAKHAGHSAGLGAAFLLAVLPLDIELASRAVADGPQTFFAALALWLFYIAPGLRGRRGPAAALLAGLCFGASYLCKVTTFWLWPVLIGYAVLRKNARVPLFLLISGCCLVLLGEATVNYYLTGDALARYHSIVAYRQATHLAGWFSDMGPTMLPGKLFLMPVKYGLHMYLAFASVLFLSVHSGKKHIFLLFWFLWFVGYVWLGTAGLLPYESLYYEGHLAIANVPMVALTAVWLAKLSSRWKWIAYLALALAGLFGSNLQLEDSESTRGLELVARELSTRTDGCPVYVNIRSRKFLAFLLPDNRNRELFSYGNEKHAKGSTGNLANVENAYVVADYWRIRRTLSRDHQQTYPPEIFSPPAHWKEILVVDNPVRQSCYAQMRLIRWLARLPMVPRRLSERATRLAEQTLRGRDVVLYFAEPRAQGNRPQEQ